MCWPSLGTNQTVEHNNEACSDSDCKWPAALFSEGQSESGSCSCELQEEGGGGGGGEEEEEEREERKEEEEDEEEKWSHPSTP